MQDDSENISMTSDKPLPLKNMAEAEAPLRKEPLSGRIIKQMLGIILAGGLLYFCFRGQNLAELWGYASQTDPRFVAIIVCTALFSHLLRAWRWVILLQPLSEHKISLFNSFAAVMYGYAVNIVIPRGGEVARLVSISKEESIPWAGVLPTMFIDRLLDIAMLVLLLGLSLGSMPQGILDDRITGSLGLLLVSATFAGLIALPFVGKIGRALLAAEGIRRAIPQRILSKAEELLVQFEMGTRSLTKVGNLALISLCSLLIWGCYFANLYFLVCAFQLEDRFDLGKTLTVFAISSVGVLVPTPGCVGSYHMLTSQAMQKIGGINSTQALAFATVGHMLTFVLLACLPAALCFVIQSFLNSRSARSLN